MIGIPRADPIISQRYQWIDAQMSTPPIGSNVVAQFLCEPNATTEGVDVGFKISSAVGVKSISLLRASVMDIKQATVLQTWAASESAFTWSDTDKRLQATGQAYYWLRLDPVNAMNGKESIAGPQFILLNPSLLAPLACTGISASHGTASNGAVLVTCNVAGVPAGGSVKIYATGYEGNASAVAVGQKTKSPVQFTLQATGETITLKAIAVSPGGAEATAGPTCTLTLTGSTTVPAKPEGVRVAQIASGNQVTWPASAEAGVTGYQLYRGQRGDPFSSASLLATVAATGEGTVEYLDTGGLGGDFQYFVIAVAPAGDSANSDPANPQVLFSSALVPGNATANTANNGTIDSVDAGSSATVRVYGAGGPGTGYTRLAGFGTVTRPGGSITGMAYATRYYVIFDGTSYQASTTYTDSLPDGYEWVGTLITCAAGYSGVGSGAVAHVNTMPIFPYTTISCTVDAPGYGYGAATATCPSIPGAAFQVFCNGGAVTGVSLTLAGSNGINGPFSLSITQTAPYTGGGGSYNGGARYVVTS